MVRIYKLYPVSTLFITSGIPLVMLDWLVSGGFLFICGSLLVITGIFLAAGSTILRYVKPALSPEYRLVDQLNQREGKRS